MKEPRKIQGRRWGGEPLSLAKPKVHVDYPMVTFEMKDIPEARKWETGNTYRVTLDLKMTSVREDKYGASAGFDVVAIVPPTSSALVSSKRKAKEVDRRYGDGGVDDSEDDD